MQAPVSINFCQLCMLLIDEGKRKPVTECYAIASNEFSSTCFDNNRHRKDWLESVLFLDKEALIRDNYLVVKAQGVDVDAFLRASFVACDG